MKTCAKCKKSKSLSFFHKDAHQKDGLFANCKSCASKYRNSKKIRDRQKAYRINNIESIKKRQTSYLRRLRSSAVEALGGKCIKCGFADTRALQIDHINGGGSKERKERNYKGSFHKHVLGSFLKGEKKYQLLCANCNWIKRFENNERNNINN